MPRKFAVFLLRQHDWMAINWKGQLIPSLDKSRQGELGQNVAKTHTQANITNDSINPRNPPRPKKRWIYSLREQDSTSESPCPTTPLKAEGECAENVGAVMENSYATAKIQDVWGLLAFGRWSWPASRVSRLCTHRRSAGLWASDGDATDG